MTSTDANERRPDSKNTVPNQARKSSRRPIAVSPRVGNPTVCLITVHVGLPHPMRERAHKEQSASVPALIRSGKGGLAGRVASARSGTHNVSGFRPLARRRLARSGRGVVVGRPYGCLAPTAPFRARCSSAGGVTGLGVMQASRSAADYCFPLRTVARPTSATATFRVLAKGDLDAAPATALRPEGPCCARLRRCRDCPEGAASRTAR
jgi:hypothetical protein